VHTTLEAKIAKEDIVAIKGLQRRKWLNYEYIYAPLEAWIRLTGDLTSTPLQPNDY
jgi:hypothetical protein